MLKRSLKHTDRMVLSDRETGEHLATIHFPGLAKGCVDVAVEAPPGVRIDHQSTESDQDPVGSGSLMSHYHPVPRD